MSRVLVYCLVGYSLETLLLLYPLKMFVFVFWYIFFMLECCLEGRTFGEEPSMFSGLSVYCIAEYWSQYLTIYRLYKLSGLIVCPFVPVVMVLLFPSNVHSFYVPRGRFPNLYTFSCSESSFSVFPFPTTIQSLTLFPLFYTSFPIFSSKHSGLKYFYLPCSPTTIMN